MDNVDNYIIAACGAVAAILIGCIIYIAIKLMKRRPTRVADIEQNADEWVTLTTGHNNVIEVPVIDLLDEPQQVSDIVASTGPSDTEFNLGCSHGSECIICHEPMDGSVTIARIPCGHSFHYACVIEWFNAQYQANNTYQCPVCRHDRPTNVVLTKVGIIDACLSN